MVPSGLGRRTRPSLNRLGVVLETVALVGTLTVLYVLQSVAKNWLKVLSVCRSSALVLAWCPFDCGSGGMCSRFRSLLTRKNLSLAVIMVARLVVLHCLMMWVSVRCGLLLQGWLLGRNTYSGNNLAGVLSYGTGTKLCLAGTSSLLGLLVPNISGSLLILLF